MCLIYKGIHCCTLDQRFFCISGSRIKTVGSSSTNQKFLKYVTNTCIHCKFSNVLDLIVCLIWLFGFSINAVYI